MAAKVKVMGISGSYGNDSNNTKLVKLGLEILSNLGAETHFWDLNEKPLPLVGEEGCWEMRMLRTFKTLQLKSMHTYFHRQNTMGVCLE